MREANLLAGESSLYLRQHAGNPVHWQPWGPEALELARSSDRPILLSIGYSACHWCHVMAHECFEDPQIAALMNELFVNIKVDREERPDLDRIYQIAHQLLAQRAGGWPLTAFLTPGDQMPFFVGTYFPPQPAHGLPGFAEVLRRAAGFFRSNRGEIEQQKGALVEVFQRIDAAAPAASLDGAPLEQVRQVLERNFDARHGGFGAAPKFPFPTGLDRLLRHWADSRGRLEDKRGLHMAVFSLERMILGGLYDQLGGGFFRYSVDEQWSIPHFEKMLYDNAQLLALCAEAWRATEHEPFARAARETARWTMREMQAPQGGYHAALDADSEGGEGRFYVWDAAEVRALLTPEEHALFARRFGLDGPAGFEGRWHLRVAADVLELTGDRREAPQAAALLDAARRKLLAARDERVRPARDEKILTSWNGLMIRGMAIAARLLDDADMAASAERAAEFVRRELWRDGRLHAVWADGRARLAAYLDDHVFLIDALLELLQLRFRSEDLRFACELADAVLAHFEDAGDGGLFFTADDHEELIHRSKNFGDDATPSGNGVGARVLARLGHLTGDTRYLAAAERTLRAGFAAMSEQPQGYCSLVTALDEYLHPVECIILRGEPQALRAWQRRACAGYAPRRICLAVPADAADLPEAIAQRRPDGEAVAYVCRGRTCSAPLTDLEALGEALGAD